MSTFDPIVYELGPGMTFSLQCPLSFANGQTMSAVTHHTSKLQLIFLFSVGDVILMEALKHTL